MKFLKILMYNSRLNSKTLKLSLLKDQIKFGENQNNDDSKY